MKIWMRTHTITNINIDPYLGEFSEILDDANGQMMLIGYIVEVI
jgi:hypothetical protein